ncbi:hypothetical protein [Staphylococcus phage SAP13_TA-2022]|nr:hypothetical protein [Staphylococcus phage SAP13_TA-2022]
MSNSIKYSGNKIQVQYKTKNGGSQDVLRNRRGMSKGN